MALETVLPQYRHDIVGEIYRIRIVGQKNAARGNKEHRDGSDLYCESHTTYVLHNHIIRLFR